MTAGFATVLAQALTLPDDERSELAVCLLRSLEPTGEEVSAEDWHGAWSAEIRRRVGEIRAGRAQLVDGDDVLAELRAVADKP
jgi:putative addiction module component (TIGR02574 family)